MPKVALAYSGSLDTTICLHYLTAIRGMKVYTFSANLGQSEDLLPLFEQALRLGAEAAHIADLRETFVTEYVFPCVRAQAVYESGYHLFSAISRPLILQETVNIAREEGCEYIGHGSRGIGNDMIRFQNGIQYLAPDLKVLAPLQELGLTSPEMDQVYAKKHRLRVQTPGGPPYNTEENVWGVNIQIPHDGGSWPVPPANTFLRTVPPVNAPAEPRSMEIEFEAGLPVKLDGKAYPPLALVEELNRIGGRYAVGRFDLIENRILGVKTREIYESPAAEILLRAHQALEALVLDKETLHFMPTLSQRYAELVYEGHWFSPLRRSLDAFFAEINERVTGKVGLELFRGNVSVTRMESRFSLLGPGRSR